MHKLQMREVSNLSEITQLLSSQAITGIQVSWFGDIPWKIR